ncbi:MAG: hypothetical protein E6G14_16045, partial [Actinobacteria bacterium]
MSAAPNLVPGDSNGREDVFVHDRTTGVTERVSVASDGSELQSYYYPAVRPPAISADGRFVAFASEAANLVPGDTNGADDVFVHDRMTGTTERVSVASDGSQAVLPVYNCGYGLVSISSDGRYVAFTSAAENLVSGDTDGKCDVFVHDRMTGTTERVSVASDGTQPDGDSSSPTISGDGTVVAFLSRARNLVAGTKPCRIYPDCSHVFVHDRTTGVTEAIDVASDGTPADDGTFDGPTVSFDGKLVAFDTYATNLVSEPTLPETWESVFLHDRGTGLTTRVSVASDGTPGTCYNLSPGMSPDGRFVAFASCA